MISTLSMIILIVPLFIVYYINKSRDTDELRKTGFEAIQRQVSSVIYLANTVQHGLSGRIKMEGKTFASKNFQDMKEDVEIILKSNQDGLRGGKQIQYVNQDVIMGIKHVLLEDNREEKLFFVKWDRENGTEGLPHPELARENLIYYQYENETTLKQTPLKMNNIDLRFIADTIEESPMLDNGVRAFHGDPVLTSCNVREDDCSYIIMYSGSMDEKPLDNGFFQVSIQIPFLSPLLKATTPQDWESFVLHVSTNTILATSEDQVKKSYLWNEEDDRHEVLTPSNYPHDGIVKKTSLYLQETFGVTYDSLLDYQPRYFNFNYESNIYYVSLVVQSWEGMDLLIVSSMYGWTFYGDAVLVFSSMILFSIILILTNTISGIGGALAIYRPINSFVLHMESITDGLDLESIRFGKNPYFSEFHRLQIAFKYLIQKLKLYRTFLPDHILKQMEVDNDSATSHDIEVDDGEVNSSCVSSVHSSLDGSICESMASSSSVYLEGEGALSLTKKNCSYIVISIAYNYPKKIGPNMSSFNRLLGVITDIARSRNGRVESFTDTQIVVGVNTIMDYRHHEKASCILALRFLEGIQSLGFLGSDSLNFGMGISSGTNHIGTIGTLTKRSWQSVGPSISLATILSMHALHTRLPILLDGNSTVSIISSTDFQLRFADELFLSSPILPKKVSVYHLVSRIIHESNEWIYELHHHQSNNWCVPFNNAIRLLHANRLNEAREELNSFLETSPKDTLSQSVLSLISFLEDQSFTYQAFVTSRLNSPSPPGISYSSLLSF